ncbi:MAG: hypothetical protein LM577_07005 [Thermoproteaceae archaeon]|nr:hypothetical protein [Thermoproteaceae archaeon]
MVLKIRRGALAQMLEGEEGGRLDAQREILSAGDRREGGGAVEAPESPWEDLLVRLLASAPEDVVQKLVNCLSRDDLIRVLERKSKDPYLRLAIILLKK